MTSPELFAILAVYSVFGLALAGLFSVARSVDAVFFRSHRYEAHVIRDSLSTLKIIAVIILCTLVVTIFLEGEVQGFLFFAYVGMLAALGFLWATQTLKERLRRLKFQTDFDNVTEDDFSNETTQDSGEYDFDPNAWDNAETETSPQNSGERENRDKRHPDDQKFWNVVDDPAAAPAEREKALRTILKHGADRDTRAAE